MFRWFLVLLLLVIVAGGAALYFRLLPTASFVVNPNGEGNEDQTAKVEVGGPLFKAVDVPAPAWTAQRDQLPVLFPVPDCQFQVIDKQDVTSIAGAGNKEGIILFVGEEVTQEDLLNPAKDLIPVDFKTGAGVVRKLYRRWKEGDVVKEKQMLAMIDPAIAITDKQMKEAKIIA